MRRKLFNLGATLSLALFAASAAMWIRGATHEDVFGVTYPLLLGDRQNLELHFAARSCYVMVWRGEKIKDERFRFGHQSRSSAPGFIELSGPHAFGFGFARNVDLDVFGPPTETLLLGAMAPIYALVVVLAIVPLIRLRATWIAERRLQITRCAKCGYDLRATPDRCPECGTAAGET